MCHTSPASFLVWAVFSSFLGGFFLFHLWSFDRFKCLKWNNGPSSGAFKRIMTYSYLLSVPLIVTYSVGFAIIKYYEGYVAFPLIGVIPKPYTEWGPVSSKAIFPLLFMFSIAWGLEMVTHLEELCFWLFLVNAGPQHQDWFRSLYFKVWVVGSSVAIVYMPLLNILSRSDPLKSEAYTYLAGSLGSLALTLGFIPVFRTFPIFLSNMRAEGVDLSIIVRLTKFSELNAIRIVFRLLFTVPLLILGIDGVGSSHPINNSMFWTDILSMVGGLGCVVSSGITLVIFFPRSIESEIAARDASRAEKRARRAERPNVVDPYLHTRTDMTQSHNAHPETFRKDGGTYLLTSSPIKQSFPSEVYDIHAQESVRHAGSMDSKHWTDDGRSLSRMPSLPPIRPNRRRGEDVELGGIDLKLTEENLSRLNLGPSNLHPMVHTFTSPIDLVYTSTNVSRRPHDSWLTFGRG